MEKEKIDKIFQKSRKYISKLGIIIILVSGTSNFLSCSMSLLNKTPEFICENKTNSSYKIEKCEPKYFCNLTKEIKYTINKKDSLDNFALKFDLYCEREKYIRQFQSSYYFGAMVGSFIFAPIADSIGREKTFKFLVLLNLFSMINLMITFHPFHLLIIFFISGSLNYTKYLCNVIVSEFSGGKNVGLSISLANSMFPILGMLSGVYFIFINKLFFIFLFITILVILIFLLSMIYMVESPKWLITQKKYKEVKNVLSFIAEINDAKNELKSLLSEEDENKTNIDNLEINNTLDSNYELETKEKENENEKEKQKKQFYTYIDILLMKSQRKKLIKICFLAFTFSMSYYGVLLGINTIAEQTFYYGFFMNFTGEVISLLSSGIISDYLGRKVVMIISAFLAGLLFIIYYILRLIFQDKIINYSGIFVGVISFCISAGYNIQGILSNEIFPTAIKSSCNGFINIIGKLASVVVPAIIYFAEDYILIIFGGFLIFGGFCSFYVNDKDNSDEEILE